jgi:hypothetical protein
VYTVDLAFDFDFDFETVYAWQKYLFLFS